MISSDSVNSVDSRCGLAPPITISCTNPPSVPRNPATTTAISLARYADSPRTSTRASFSRTAAQA